MNKEENKKENKLDQENVESSEISEDVVIDEEQAKQILEMVEKLKVSNEEYKNSALRWQAEFENYKRRNASIRRDSLEEGQREIVFAILPAIDSLSRALLASDADTDIQSLKDGVMMTYRLLVDSIAQFGIEQINAAGEKFDPNIHDAVVSGESAEGEESGMVQEELLKGYIQNDKVIRPSMVKVSQ